MLSPTACLPARDPTRPGFNKLLPGLYQFHLDDQTPHLVAWSGNLPLSEGENRAGSALTCTPVLAVSQQTWISPCFQRMLPTEIHRPEGTQRLLLPTSLHLSLFVEPFSAALVVLPASSSCIVKTSHTQCPALNLKSCAMLLPLSILLWAVSYLLQ